MTLEIRGSLNFGAVRPALAAGARRGVAMAGEHVLQVANTKVPNDEGTLERSGRVSVDDGGTSAAVSYDTPYAVRQHEDLTYRHPGGREAKFLERAFTQEQSVCADLVAAQIRRALR